MSFLGNLAKGFVRSAVNQVGRDTGRVVSNKLYGNSHSTPIRGVSCENGYYLDEESKKEITEKEFNEMLTREGYCIEHFTMNPFAKAFSWYLGMIGTGLIIAFDGGFWALLIPSMLILIAIFKYFGMKDHMNIYTKKMQATYKIDKRYSNCKRYVGESLQKVDYTINPTKSYKIDIIIICIIYVLLAVWMYHTAVVVNEISSNGFTQAAVSCVVILSLHIIMRFRQRIK